MIKVEKLKGGYEFFSTMDGYFLVNPDGTHKFFVTYEEVERYCNKNGIEF